MGYWIMGCWSMGYWSMGYWSMGYWSMGYWIMGKKPTGESVCEIHCISNFNGYCDQMQIVGKKVYN